MNSQKIFQQQFLEAGKLLASKKKIAVLTHTNPDGDAIGSLLGLGLFLKAMGHDVQVMTPNPYPEFLQWLPGNGEVVIFTRRKAKAIRIIEEAEIIFCLDFNASNRFEGLETCLQSAKGIKILIDHHPHPQPEYDLLFSNTAVSSTAELVYEFMEGTGKKDLISKEIAECLYVGIMTDTGNFSFNSSEMRTFEIVAALLNLGIEKDKIYSLVYDNFSENRMRLLGYCLSEKMVVLPEYHTAYISLNQEEQQRFKFDTGDSEGFVNYPLSIKGIIFSALLTEQKDKSIRISFRSKGSFATNVFAETHFEGGGHKNASGGKSLLPLNETISKFEALLPLFKKDLEY